MDLGVQTHFAQGWNPTLLDKLAALGVTEIRDSQPWQYVEKSTDVYKFTPNLMNYMAKADGLGIGTLLTFASSNALYDNGLTPYTQAGRDAYADYIVAVLSKYGDQVQEIEIWNEFNTGNFTGPADSDDPTYYTALLKTVYEKVKPLFPDVEILGGSTNVIATGALESIFKLGALNYMDGVVVHPYRSSPEHVDDELQHLNDVMAKYGSVKPIYATEFGNEFTNAADVPDFMLKMVTLMASVHVAEASWYAAMDQKYYKNMGLFATDGTAKPAAASFEFIEKSLIPLGDPVKIATGDDTTVVYRFGSDTYVMWSSGRNVSFNTDGTFYNSKGEIIAAPTTLGMSPVVFKGSGFTLGTSNVVADTLMQFGEGDWQYFAQGASRKLVELSNVDWEWTSYLGSKYTKPLMITGDKVVPAGSGASAIHAIERYTSTSAQTIAVNGSWTTGTTGDGVDLHILVNGKDVFTKVFSGTFTLSDYEIALKAGDTVDFSIGPNIVGSADTTTRRVILTRVDGQPHITQSVTIGDLPLKVVDDSVSAATPEGKDAPNDVRGGAGDDVLHGFGGNDRLSGGAGTNVIDGGEGFDTVSYADATEGVTVKLGTSGARKINSTTSDKLISIEGVEGSAFNDKIYGTADGEHFAGGAGDDWFAGGGGADRIDGGAGIDTLSFEKWENGVSVSLRSNDTQSVNAGNSVQITSIEKLIGSSFSDSLTAGDAGSELVGGDGADLLIGGRGNDILSGGKGNDTVSYATASAGVTVSLMTTTAQNTIGAGTDTLSTVENLIGSSFSDRLTGSNIANRIDGGAGDDVISGGGAADLLIGGLGADRFTFAAVGDSKPEFYDVIDDFSAAQGDKIDLSALDANTKMAGNQAFSLIDRFTKHAGELMISAEDGGWLIEADMNGDGRADFGIHVHSTGAPTLNDLNM